MMSMRATTLTFSCIVALSAGTNYVYSAYAPQLASKLSLSSTQVNVVGLSANLGVYLSGVPIGMIVDKRGPRMTLIFSAIVLGLGYEGVRAFYDGGEFGIFSVYGIKGIAFAEFLTGVGSSAGLSSAANATAKSFGPKSRGSRMSLVMSCFGLSAFVYSTLSHSSFLAGGDATSNFLLLISIGCTVSMFLGAIFIKPPPAPPTSTPSGYRSISTLEEGGRLPSTPRGSRPSTPSLSSEERTLGSSIRSVSSTRSIENSSDEEERDRIRRDRKDKEISQSALNITGLDLIKQKDFWILFSVMGLCSGTGLMYINNIGTVVATLEPLGSDPKSIAKLQASLVSLLSIFNCLGRLLSGFCSDYFAHHVAEEYRIARVWWLVPMASMFVASQLMASITSTAEGAAGLALPTAITGLAYGQLFGLMPILSIEWFGITSFSSNNGVVSLAPALFGNLCNLLFGKIYDHHVPIITIPSPPTLSIPLLNLTSEALVDITDVSDEASIPRMLLRRMVLDERGGMGPLAVDRLCTQGKACYESAFHTTTAMTFLAILLSIYVARRRGALMNSS